MSFEFYAGFIVGCLVILSIVTLPRPKPRPVQMVAPSLPPMAVHRERELGDRW